jgi:hypothetical protein
MACICPSRQNREALYEDDKYFHNGESSKYKIPSILNQRVFSNVKIMIGTYLILLNIMTKIASKIIFEHYRIPINVTTDCTDVLG